MFGKYYRREKITYWFYSLMPLIIWAEICVYILAAHANNQEAMEMLNYFLTPLSFIAGGILIIIQVISCAIFMIRLYELTPEQRTAVKNVAHNSKKTGIILQTGDVLIYYGMFSKKVLNKNEFRYMKRSTGKNQASVRGGSVFINYDIILILMKSGKKIELTCPMKVLDGYKGELPLNYMIAVALFGVAFLIMGLYPVLMDCFVDKNDAIERVLFHAGYDWIFWIVSVILIAVLGIVAFYTKHKYINDENYKALKVKQTLVWYVLLVLLFLFLFFNEKFEDSQMARADLKMYSHGQYVQKTVYASEIRKYSSACGSWYIYEYMDNCGTNYACLYYYCMDFQQKSYSTFSSAENPGNSWEEYYLLVDCEKYLELEKKYRLHYLENTLIVVKIEMIE